MDTSLAAGWATLVKKKVSYLTLNDSNSRQLTYEEKGSDY